MTVKINDTLVTSSDLQGQTANYFDTDLKLLAPSSSDDKIKRLLSCDSEKQYLQYKAQQSIPYDLSTTNYISVTQQPEDNTELFTNVSSINRCLPFNLSFNVSNDAISAGTRYLLEQPNLLQCKSQDNTLYFKIPAWENAWKKVDSNVLSNNNLISLEASNDGTTLVKNYYAYTNSDTYYIDTEIPAEEPTFILQNATNNGCTDLGNGVYGGFGTSQKQYIISTNKFNFTADTWSIITKIKFYSSKNSWFLGSGFVGSESKFSILLGTDSSNHISALLSSGSGWNISGTTSSKTFNLNEYYYIKYYFTGTSYKVDLSTTGEFTGEEENFINVSSSTKVYNADNYIMWGANPYGGNAGQNLDGEIDMKETLYTTNGITTTFGPFIPKSTIYQKVNNEFNKLAPQPAFTAKVPGLLNASVVGTLTDNDGIYSGFSTSNYFLTDNNFNPQSSNWEIIIKFKTSNDISTQQAIIGGGGAYSKIILEVYNGHFRLRISSNNSSFNVFDDFGTYNVQTNTDYIIRCRYNNTTGYTMEYKTLDGSYQLDSSTSNITAIYDSSTPLSLGANKYNSSSVNVPFSGNIDMSQTSITIDGVTTNFYNTVNSITFDNTEYIRDTDHDDSEDIYVANQLQLKVNNATYTLIDNMDDMPIITTGTLAIREDLRR